ncbi:MAG: cysteine--tRNA ligase [Litorilinea sp.]
MHQFRLYDATADKVVAVESIGPIDAAILGRLAIPHPSAAGDSQPRAQSVYVCGITPYDTTHLGHAFTYAVADHLIRLLELLGQRVHYVQNVTDIDDDILRKAGEVGQDWRSLGNRWTRHFIQDMQRLNIRPPDHYPRASAYIPQMVQAIETLLQRGLAYVAQGSVYYDAIAWPKFGQISRLDADELLPTANEHGNLPEDPHKRHPLDFPLWQAQQPDEPAWESPWGPGRPGWHIECSSMAAALLGNTVDFHGGGSDLAFPHHECEIAQSEPVSGAQPFVRHWFHAAMVEYEGEKMSKSLGNLIMARDLLEEVSPDALRLYLADHHYRQPWSYSRHDLQNKANQVAQWSLAVTTAGGKGTEFDFAPQQVVAVMDAYLNDLDTPSAIHSLDGLAQELLAAAQAGREVSAARRTFIRLAGVLGLRLVSAMPEAPVVAGWNRHLHEFNGAQTADAAHPA